MTIEDLHSRADQPLWTSALTERTVQLSTVVRPEWRRPEWDRPTVALATVGWSTRGGARMVLPRSRFAMASSLVDGAAVLGAALLLTLVLAFVVRDLVWLPWPALLTVVALLLALAAMVVRLTRPTRSATWLRRLR